MMNKRKKDPKTMMKVFYYLGMIKIYHNGDGYNMLGKYWNPLYWLFFILIFSLSLILYGIIESWKMKYSFGLGLNPYLKKNSISIEYWKP